MANKIWTPDGDITTHADVNRATPRDMEILMAMHDVAQKFGMVVVCRKCDSSFQGNNASPNSRLMSISCKCREIRAEMRQTLVV